MCMSGKQKGDVKFDTNELTALGIIQQVQTSCPTAQEAEKQLTSAWTMVHEFGACFDPAAESRS